MCKINCGYCGPNQAHICKICHAVDEHLRLNCPSAKTTPCVFKCGQCLPGNPHWCKYCNAYNHHRSVDCNQNPARTPVRPATYVAPISLPTAAAVVVISNQYILIQLRASWLGGKYATPGGSIDQGESSLDAALREAKEEAGLTLDGSNTTVIDSMYGSICNTYIVQYTGNSMSFPKGKAAHECDPIPSHIPGMDASYGHKWMKPSDILDLVNQGKFLPAAEAAIFKAIKLM